MPTSTGNKAGARAAVQGMAGGGVAGAMHNLLYISSQRLLQQHHH